MAWRTNRRSFITGAARATASVALGAGLAAPAAEAARGPGVAGIEIALDHDWRFGGAYRTGAPLPSRPERGWAPVDLPHCVVDLSWRGWDPETWEDRWLYGRALTLPDAAAHGRVLLDFDGVLSATTPVVNGRRLPETRGGYLPFSYELTGLAGPGDNELVVLVDGRWRQIPPSGSRHGPRGVDYLQPAGISRHVGVRVVPSAYVHDVFVSPAAPARGSFDAPVSVTVDARDPLRGAELVIALRDLTSGELVASAQRRVPALAPGRRAVALTLPAIDPDRWSPSAPRRYALEATLVHDAGSHSVTVTTGFRSARFERDGFVLNGERLRLFGINRHQLFPYLGMAAPDRLQRRDAEILKHELNVNAVRCSHYPQAPAFLDACDELGMIVWEEVPGWRYVGGVAWRELWYRDVTTMVTRDRNRPSVVIWGVQPNETRPPAREGHHARALADAADGSRPTSGTTTRWSRRGYDQPVFAFDDYTTATSSGELVPELEPPIPGMPYLVTEAVGARDASHFFERNGDQVDLQRQAVDHGMVHSQAQAPGSRYAGLLGWAGFDWASLNGYRIDGLKTPGVIDTFRVPKPGAAIYRAQIDPGLEPVIAPAFSWYLGADAPVTALGAQALVCSNCDEVRATVGDVALGPLPRAGDAFAHLRYPPFALDTAAVTGGLPELRLDGFIAGTRVVSRSFSADTTADRLALTADDAAIVADGSDATRIVFAAVDRHGNLRAYADGTVTLALRGPGRLIGGGPFDFAVAGAVGAAWLRSRRDRPGAATVSGSHPTLGDDAVRVRITPRSAA